MEIEWLIWSNEHGAWWAEGQRGYVVRRRQAGKYSFMEACRIVFEANQHTTNIPNEAMVKTNAADYKKITWKKET